ncbi:threonine ammonia-lyase [Aeromicrobium alkaliterrae]|uniref:L-threonine dehydratase catabolic TdcB n=1 Tax=Aeromicrobium alkaliterrae TaxID=302168 RepID=A0ABP4VWG8_9ACTN
MTTTLPSWAGVEAAAELLTGVAEVTPLAHSRWLSELTGTEVLLKCENLQRTGSFKLRGAYTRIARLTDAERAAGVVAASAGNHAQGVALAAQMLGIKARIYMPEGAALPKVQATQGYGADIELTGVDVEASIVAAREYADRTGAILIHPFDHGDVVVGQGTVGLEILRQLPEVGTVLVPLGGGGLVAGIALLREVRPDVKVVGVQTAAVSPYVASLSAGTPMLVPGLPTMADGIAVAQPGAVPFAVVADLVDDVVTVTEESMSRALIGLLERAKLLVEPAGAAGVAALLDRPHDFDGPVVPVLSGGNIDALLLLEVIRHGLKAAGRFLSFRVHLTDRPGELMRLLTDLASMQVNILNVVHDRASEALGVGEVEVALQVATRGPGHADKVMTRLAALGYRRP